MYHVIFVFPTKDAKFNGGILKESNKIKYYSGLRLCQLGTKGNVADDN